MNLHLPMLSSKVVSRTCKGTTISTILPPPQLSTTSSKKLVNILSTLRKRRAHENGIISASPFSSFSSSFSSECRQCNHNLAKSGHLRSLFRLTREKMANTEVNLIMVVIETKQPGCHIIPYVDAWDRGCAYLSY